MPSYVLLTRLKSRANRLVLDEPERLKEVRKTLEQFEAKIIADYHLLGKYDHCTIFEISDNFRAQKAVLHEELTSSKDTMLLAAIDMPLFQRLLQAEIQTVGPHEWQVKWWAKSVRLCFRWYQYSRWMWRYCKPFTVTGLENFKAVKGVMSALYHSVNVICCSALI